MGSHIARWGAATLNLLLSLICSALFAFIVQTGSGMSGAGTYLPVLFYWCFYALMTVAAMLATVLLLRRQTVETGLKIHFGIANAGLFLLLVSTLLSAWSNPTHQVSPWVLREAYWFAAFSGLWFGTGLTIRVLQEVETSTSKQEETPESCALEVDVRLAARVDTAAVTGTAESNAPVILGQRRSG